MATIARNRALDEVRRVKPAALEDQAEGFDPASEFVHPLDGRERSEELKRLMNCLSGLDEERRSMVLLAYYKGASRDTLADAFRQAGRDDQDNPPPIARTASGVSRDMSEEIDMLAGEYVLGTLDAAERAMVAARRQREPALDQAIRAWEARLGPLVEDFRPKRRQLGFLTELLHALLRRKEAR